LHSNPVTAIAIKVTVAVVGTLVVLTGVVMFVTPGPAVVVIPLGLAILATEFAFARRWLEAARRWAVDAKARADAVDPRVRRRRLLLAGTAVLLVAGGVTVYVATYDWPGWSVDGWDLVQSLAGWVPELPGM
jgi:uncharacterized protein (TIGR02611 family)